MEGWSWREGGEMWVLVVGVEEVGWDMRNKGGGMGNWMRGRG